MLPQIHPFDYTPVIPLLKDRPSAPRVLEFLRSLENRIWFNRCGTPHPQDATLIRCPDKKTAIEHLPSLWKFRGQRVDRFWDQAEVDLGLKKAQELSDASFELDLSVKKMIGIALERWYQGCPSEEENMAFGMLLEDAALTASALWFESAELSEFQLHTMSYYKDGYWPCGWSGEYPDGKLILH